MDGSFCSIEEADKLAWLKELSVDHDIINFEMEAPLFLAFCRRAGIPSAIMCCAMLNRFEGDQINTPKGEYVFLSSAKINFIPKKYFVNLSITSSKWPLPMLNVEFTKINSTKS